MRELVSTGGALACSFDTSIPARGCAEVYHELRKRGTGVAVPRRRVEQKILLTRSDWQCWRSAVAKSEPRELTSVVTIPSRSPTARGGLTSARSVQRGIVRPDFLGMPVRLCELVDCHLKTANDQRRHP